MAIIQDREPNGLRIGSMQNVYAESIVHENYVSDMIKAYGTDIRYFKLKTPYPDVFRPILDSNNLAIHAYGEGYVQEWEDPVRMIAFLKWDSDSIILNAYGVQPDSTLTMWLDQTDFAIALAKKLSRWREFKVVGHSEFILDFNDDADLIANQNNIVIDFKTDLFDGSLKAIIDDRTLNTLLLPDNCQEIASPLPITIPCKLLPNHSPLKIDTGRINPLLYKGNHYDPFEDGMVDCHLHLEVFSVQQDRHGCVRIMGGIRGGVIYHDTTVIGKYLDKIRPEVGDLIDIPVPGKDGTEEIYNQKYEIVHIEETITNESYMNPFMRKYLYQCNLRAYIASGQTEPEEQKSKIEKKDKLDLINQAAENAAKKIGLYEDFEDDVYGGYHKINKRGNPSVQRDVKNSTINNFDKPDDKAKAKLPRKSTTPLFIFKDMKMVLSLVSDPKNNSSSLKLSPLKKSTKIGKDVQYIECLRADNDNLILTDGTRSYLLASRYNKIPEFDEQTYCLKPIRLKHEVYAQHNGWADQPFHQVDAPTPPEAIPPKELPEDPDNMERELNMDLQDLIGKNTTPEGWKSASENRLCFPWTNSYLEVEYEKPEEGMEVWTCYVVLAGDADQNHLPICAYVKNKQ